MEEFQETVMDCESLNQTSENAISVPDQHTTLSDDMPNDPPAEEPTTDTGVKLQEAASVLRKYFPEQDVADWVKTAEQCATIATARAEEIKNRKDEEDEELNRIYSVLIPGYTNASAVRVTSLAALIYGTGLSNSRLAEIFQHLNFWDIDNAIFIAYHAQHNMDGAGVYHEACKIVAACAESKL